MAKYTVKLGHHGIDGKIYRVGDTFESKNESLAAGDGSRFFEKVVEQPAAAKDGPKGKGRGNGKKTEAGEGQAAAGAEDGATAAPEA